MSFFMYLMVWCMVFDVGEFWEMCMGLCNFVGVLGVSDEVLVEYFKVMG